MALDMFCQIITYSEVNKMPISNVACYPAQVKSSKDMKIKMRSVRMDKSYLNFVITILLMGCYISQGIH